MRLIHGEALATLREMPDGCVDAVVTDPPWGIGIGKSDNRKGQGGGGKHWGRANRAYADFDDAPGTVCDLIREVMPQILRVARRAVIFSGTRCLWAYPPADDVGCVFSSAGAGRSDWGFACCSPILYYGKCPYLSHRDDSSPHGLGARPNSFSSNDAAEKVEHPCNKPLSWMRWAVKRAARRGETVLDPFMGSGTTGVACVIEGRDFVGVEQFAGYVAVASRRVSEAEACRDGRGVGELFAYAEGRP